MMPVPFRRVVLTTDLPGEELRAGDVGVVVEHYPGRGAVPEGYEAVRETTDHEVLSVRELARA